MISPTLLGPQYGHKIAATEHFPKVLQECCRYDFVKYSLVCMAAMKYFQVTRMEDSNRVVERYKGGALRGMQEAVVHCGTRNADAIVAASILMMEAAQNWHQWSIYLAGYSAVLAMNLTTHFNELQSSKFNLKLFPRTPSANHILPSAPIRSTARTRIKTLLSSFAAIKPFLLRRKEEHCSSFEFKNIENLGQSLLDVDELESTEDVYMQFSLLKSWMFCVELKSSSDSSCHNELGAKLVRLHFYGFLKAMIPYFPPGCEERLRGVCGREIEELKEEVMREGEGDVRGLVEDFWS